MLYFYFLYLRHLTKKLRIKELETMENKNVQELSQPVKKEWLTPVLNEENISDETLLFLAGGVDGGTMTS